MKKLLALLAVLTIVSTSFAAVTIFEGKQNRVDFDVKLGGYFQFNWDYNLNNHDDNIDGEGDLFVRRGMVSLRSTIGDYWSFKADFNALGGRLDEVALTFKPVDMFFIDFGMMKPSTTFLNTASASRQPFIDRPQHDAWAPTVAEGIVLNLDYENYIDFRLGIWDADNLTAFGDAAVGDMAITAYANSRFMPGLNVGGFLYYNGDSMEVGDETFDLTFMGFGGHANYTHDFFYAGFQAFLVNLDFDGEDASAMSISFDALGRFAIGSDFLDLFEVGGRFEMVDPNQDIDDNGWMTITGGFNLYFTPSHFAKLQLNYIHTIFEDDDWEAPGWIKAQLQLAF